MFKPGETGNSHGRPAGVPNKRTLRLNDLLANSGIDYCKEFWKALKNLPEDQQFKEIKGLLPYIVPMLLAVGEETSSPEESVANAQRLMSELKSIENANKSSTSTNTPIA